jgi:hypothetical protein
LGLFAPIGQLLSSGSYFENGKSIQKFWLHFNTEKSYALCLAKNVLGYILGLFFHKFIWSPCIAPNRQAGLPGCMFSNQKSKFGLTTKGLGMKKVGTCIL